MTLRKLLDANIKLQKKKKGYKTSLPAKHVLCIYIINKKKLHSNLYAVKLKSERY